MDAENQMDIFDILGIEEEWKEHWKDMPEFIQKDLTSEKSIIVHFRNKEDRDTFSKLVEQKITYKTQSIWFPKAEIEHMMNQRYSKIDENIDLKD